MSLSADGGSEATSQHTGQAINLGSSSSTNNKNVLAPPRTFYTMAPLLLTHFRARQRSVLTSLFAATFLGAVVVVAFPCPARPAEGARLEASPAAGERSPAQKEVIVMMNQRGRRRFMEE